MYCGCHNCHTSFPRTPRSCTGTRSSLRDLNPFSPAYPALKRWAKLGRPSGAGAPVTPRGLLLFVLGLNLLWRRLHYIVTNRTLHSVLIGIVVNHGMLTTKIVERRRRSRAPLE